MSSEPSDYVTRQGRCVKAPAKYSPTCLLEQKKMSKQTKLTGQYKNTKLGRKTYINKMSDAVTGTLELANLKAGKTRKQDDGNQSEDK